MNLARLTLVLSLGLSLALFACSASGQAVLGPPVQGEPALAAAATPVLPAFPEFASGQSINPLEMLESVGQSLPGGGSDGPRGMSAALNIMLMLTVISLAPSIMLMTTSFIRIIVVLGLMKQAMGTQSLPPSQVIVGLALFMTLLVMTPTIDRIHEEAIVPYRNGQITDYETLWDKAKQPVRDFMFDQIQATGNWSSLYMVLNYRGVDTSQPELLTEDDVDLISLIPAYMLSELKTGFLMGFRVYLPFLVIDMVVASLLISMSMMMLPPVLISLPFKILLFVLVDGWQLVVGSLLLSFRQETLELSSVSDISTAITTSAIVAAEPVVHAAGLVYGGLVYTCLG